MTLTVSGLLDSSGNPAASSLIVTIGATIGVVGVNQVPYAVLPSSIPGAVQLPFVISSNAPQGPNEAVSVALGTRVSVQAFTIPIF